MKVYCSLLHRLTIPLIGGAFGSRNFVCSCFPLLIRCGAACYVRGFLTWSCERLPLRERGVFTDDCNQLVNDFQGFIWRWPIEGPDCSKGIIWRR